MRRVWLAGAAVAGAAWWKACEIAKRDLQKNITHTRTMRDKLHKGLGARIEDIKLNGHPKMRLPNTLSLSFQGIDATTLLSELKEHVAVSAGAACHSKGDEISRVLRAMNVPSSWARGTLRFSTGRMTTELEIERATKIVSDAVAGIRKEG